LNNKVRPSRLSATAMPPAAMSIGCTWRRTVCSISASLSARAAGCARSPVLVCARTVVPVLMKAVLATASVAQATIAAVVTAAVRRIVPSRHARRFCLRRTDSPRRNSSAAAKAAELIRVHITSRP
jgi:hypothetical protein